MASFNIYRFEQHLNENIKQHYNHYLCSGKQFLTLSFSSILSSIVHSQIWTKFLLFLLLTIIVDFDSLQLLASTIN